MRLQYALLSMAEGNVMSDQVNSPDHYKSGGIEAIEYIKAKLSNEEFAGYLRGNIIKYVSRANLKGSELEDYEKAQWYLRKLIEAKK